MKLRPRNIPKFQGGGTPQWYLDLYPQLALEGWNNNLRYNYASLNLNTNDHYNAGNLDTVYRKQNTYTQTPAIVGLDIQSFYDSDGGNMTAEEFVNFYNENAQKIRDHWAKNQTYNASSAGDHNRLYRRMFKNRSNTSLSPGSEYNIGYLEGTTPGGYDIQDIEGSSTWLRRMDRYENEFDPNNPDANRIHTIRLKDGTLAQVYKKANGDIGLLGTELNPESGDSITGISGDQLTGAHNDKYGGFNLKSLQENLNKYAPDLLALTRLGVKLNTNDRMYKAALEGINPLLQGSFRTHRQVVGDEASKQAYYRRAAELQSRASRPSTSDLDRYLATQMEAHRIGNESRAQGDIIDNQEIRRTSDESNQHQWSNIERDNKVANSNYLALLHAAAEKALLKANRIAADSTSLDNYLLEKQTEAKEKKYRNKAIQEQIAEIEYLNEIENDKTYLQLYNDYLKAKADATSSDGILDTRNEKFRKAKSEFDKYKRDLYIKRLEGMYQYRRGGKTTYYDDTLLYKTARDAVEHFRKMSKASNDAMHRAKKKSINLNSYPKRMQLGGMAPFVVYTPATVGGQRSTYSTDSASSGSSKKKEDSPLDVIKELFKEIKGLPTDVNRVYTTMSSLFDEYSTFGGQMSTEDLASLYLGAMRQLNNVKYSKEAFDAAKKLATENEALSEIAVTSDGRYVVLNEEGKISYATLSQIKEGGLNPVTNELLLNLRAYSPAMAFLRGDEMMQIVNNGVGMGKISEKLKSIIPSIGESEIELQGFTKHEAGQIKKGLEVLQEAPTGDYKYTITDKNQKQQAELAIRYLGSVLPKNMMAVLQMNAFQRGTDAGTILASLVGSGLDTTHKIHFDPLTGKAAKGKGDGTSSGKGTDTPSVVSFLLGQGYLETINYDIGNSQSIKVKGRYGILQDKEKNNLGLGSTFQDLSKSLFGPVLDLDKATFGGSRLNTVGYNHIVLNNSDAVGMDLPVIKDKFGNYIPDFQQTAKIEQAEEEIYNNKITDYNLINLIYLKYGLKPKFDSNGNLIKENYRRFAAVTAILDQKALKDEVPANLSEVLEASDTERELFIESMKKQGLKDYDLYGGFLWTNWFQDKLYKGTVFIPVREDLVAGYISGGQPLDTSLPDDAQAVAQMQHMPKVSLYKQAPSLSQLLNK